MNYSLSIVLPAKDEEEIIANTIKEACEVAASVSHDFEIIVVNDGSSDKTGAICDDLRTGIPNLYVVHHPQNKGYGAALRSGISKSSKDLIFFSDSDGQFDLNEIHKLMEHITDYNIVVGYRKNRQDHYMRLVNAWCWGKLVRLVLNVRIRDIDCAFKLFHKEVFCKIDINSVGAMVNTEIFAQASNFKYKIKELPVKHLPRVSGNPTGANLRVILKAFRELYVMRQHLKAIRSENASGLLSDSKEPCSINTDKI